MVEDLNNILNAGDVPNLYAAEDEDTIVTACRTDCQVSGAAMCHISIWKITTLPSLRSPTTTNHPQPQPTTTTHLTIPPPAQAAAPDQAQHIRVLPHPRPAQPPRLLLHESVG